MPSSASCVIGVPVFKDTFSPAERLSLACLKQNLSDFEVKLISPVGLKTELPYSIQTFDQGYFHSPRTYSKLLLSKHFYEAFAKYDYLLIYQLDALVFSPSLEIWLKKKYDYIGAPWWNSITGWLTHPQHYRRLVGNGGLSLRNVQHHLDVLEAAALFDSSRLPTQLQFLLALIQGKTDHKWLTTSPSEYPFNEDGFWSCEALKYFSGFKVAPVEEAIKFAWETNPKKAWDLAGHQLPFGVHAWEKHDPEFMKELIITHLDQEMYDSFFS